MEALYNHDDPDSYFDQPVAEDAAPLIPLGLSQYRRHVKHLLENYMGDDKTYLTNEEDYELASLIQQGLAAQSTLQDAPCSDSDEDVWHRAHLRAEIEKGEAARQKLIECNLRFASYMARASMNIMPNRKAKDEVHDDPEEADIELSLRNKKPGTYADIRKLHSRYASLEDRIQMANLGLVVAASKYKPTINKHGKIPAFTTFAAWEIQATLQRGILGQEMPGIAPPVHVLEQASRTLRDYDPAIKPTTEQEEALSLTALKDALSLYAVKIKQNNDTDVSTYETDEDAEAVLTLANVVADDNAESPENMVYLEDLRGILQRMFETISPREATTVIMRYGLADDDPKTFDEIGQVLGVTRERVRQIESKAMAQLRHPSRSKYVRDFLPDDGMVLTSENNLLGSRMSPELFGLASYIVRSTTTGGGFIGVNRESILGEPSARTASHDWRAYPEEHWDDPVRLNNQELLDSFALAERMFRKLMSSALYGNDFTRLEEAEPAMPYPTDLIGAITEDCGNFLRVHHIEQFWNERIEGYVEKLERRHGDMFDLDRLSLFFSQIIKDRMTDSDRVELNIPANLADKLNGFGSGLNQGELIVHGNLGDRAGENMSGLASLIVHGDVGDYAASNMSGLTSMEITGDAGKMCADGALDGTLRVGGNVHSLSLPKRFEGDVYAGSIGYLFATTPKNHVTIL